MTRGISTLHRPVAAHPLARRRPAVAAAASVPVATRPPARVRMARSARRTITYCDRVCFAWAPRRAPPRAPMRGTHARRLRTKSHARASRTTTRARTRPSMRTPRRPRTSRPSSSSSTSLWRSIRSRLASTPARPKLSSHKCPTASSMSKTWVRETSCMFLLIQLCTL